MGELERQDWREVLAHYPAEQIIAALDRLMKEPPKMNLGDGSVQAYTGRPTVVNVTQTIDEMRAEAAARRREQESKKREEEMRELKKRQEAGEKFYGLADLAADFKKLMATKAMPGDEKQATPANTLKGEE